MLAEKAELALAAKAKNLKPVNRDTT